MLRLCRPLRILLTWFIVIVPTSARAQDACIALLQHGIFDTRATSAAASSFGSFRSNFCNWYSSYRQTHTSGSTGLSIPIADIPLGFNASLSYGEADAMSQAMCSSTASQSSADSSWQQIDRVLSPAGTSAFSACVAAKNGGLNVDFRVNDDESLLTVGLSYAPPLNGTPATLNSITTTGWICDPVPAPQIDLRSIVGQEHRLNNSQLSLTCRRDIKPQPFVQGGENLVAMRANLTLATSAGLYSAFFRPIKYNDPLADTAKVMASYPRGTILPFAGPRATIPIGWHICDGTAGTVNLISRVPYGTDQDAQIGKQEGRIDHSHSTVATTTPLPTQIVGFAGDPNGSFQTLGNQRQAHVHTIPSLATDTVPNLPPATRVIFIQKIN